MGIREVEGGSVKGTSERETSNGTSKAALVKEEPLKGLVRGTSKGGNCEGRPAKWLPVKEIPVKVDHRRED